MVGRDDFPLPDLSDERTAGYFEGAAAGELRIPRCDRCHRLVWYPVDACPYCANSDFTWVATSGRGSLFTWAVVRRSFLPAFDDQVPFVSAIVALDDDRDVRIVSRLVEVDPDADAGLLAPGLAVKAVFRPLSFATVPGREVVVPLFVPAISPDR